jgi:hypothetical protein
MNALSVFNPDVLISDIGIPHVDDSGFQLYIPKPVNPLELAVVVANLVGRT